MTKREDLEALKWPVEMEDVFHRVTFLLDHDDVGDEPYVRSWFGLPVADVKVLLTFAKEGRAAALRARAAGEHD